MTATLLKFIAVMIMTADHIHEFIPGMPLWMTWVGRLAAPVFFFLSVESYFHTSSRRKYFLRLYIASVIMGIVGYVTGIDNNIFRTILSGLILCYGCDLYKEKNYRGILYLLLWQITAAAVIIILQFTNVFSSASAKIYMPLLGSIFCVEGGLPNALLGLFFYMVRGDKKKASAVLIAFAILYTAVFQFNVIGKILWRCDKYGFEGIFSVLCTMFFGFDAGPAAGIVREHSLLYDNYWWMDMFAVPLILAYNGKKGKGCKWFFYIYYPVHLIVLNMITHFLF